MLATIQVTIVHHPVCPRLLHIEICKAMHECGGMNWIQLAKDMFHIYLKNTVMKKVVLGLLSYDTVLYPRTGTSSKLL